MQTEEQRPSMLIRHLIYPRDVLDETGGLPVSLIPSQDLQIRGWSVDSLPPFTFDEFQAKKNMLLAGNPDRHYDGALTIALLSIEQVVDQETGSSLFEIIPCPTDENPSHTCVYLTDKQKSQSKVKQAREKINEVAKKLSEEQLVALIKQYS